MRTPSTLLLTLLLLLLASSCATITRGSTDTVIIRTTPNGASVYLSNGMQGTTPAQFEVPRDEPLLVSIEKDGFKPMEVHLNPVLSSEGTTGMAGNILLGGIIGAAVDAGSGAMYDLTPNPLEVVLIPLGSTHEYPMEERLEDLYDEGFFEDFDDGYSAMNEDLGWTEEPGYQALELELDERLPVYTPKPTPGPASDQTAQKPQLPASWAASKRSPSEEPDAPESKPDSQNDAPK